MYNLNHAGGMGVGYYSHVDEATFIHMWIISILMVDSFCQKESTIKKLNYSKLDILNSQFVDKKPKLVS